MLQMTMARPYSRSLHLLCATALMFWLVGAAATFSPGSTISPGFSRFFGDTAPHYSAQSPEQAATAALNDIAPTSAGYELRNPRHSAAFTTDGLRFTPQRGGPSWHWQLRHVGADATVLPSVTLGAVAPQQDAPGVVAYSRGALVERYLARPESVEQQFVIEQPLGLGGADLTLEGAVRSAGAFEATPRGWLWRNSIGVVSLGSVFVYDAHGQPLPATMSVTRNSTRIVVNGDALARAAYPVTIDPEIGTNDFQISAMGTADDPATQLSGFDTAVAFNSTSGEYLVVWAGDNIAPTVDGKSEIWGQRINAASGAKVGSQFRISNIGTASNTSFDALKPAVSYNSTNNEYLVVWTGDTNAGALVDGEFEIYGQRISASGAELGTNDFRISSSDDGFSYFDANEPDVTYNPTGNEYLVVWSGTITATNSATAEFEILGQRLNGATGAEVGTGDFRISDMAQDGEFLIRCCYAGRDLQHNRQ